MNDPIHTRKGWLLGTLRSGSVIDRVNGLLIACHPDEKPLVIDPVRGIRPLDYAEATAIDSPVVGIPTVGSSE